MLLDAISALLPSDYDDKPSSLIKMKGSFVVYAIGHFLPCANWGIAYYRVKRGVDAAVNVAFDNLDAVGKSKFFCISFRKFEGPYIDI